MSKAPVIVFDGSNSVQVARRLLYRNEPPFVVTPKWARPKLPRGVRIVGLGERGMAFTTDRSLTYAEAEAIKAHWYAQYAGTENAHRAPGILR